MNDSRVMVLPDEVLDAPLAFGLAAQGHLPTIQAMLIAGKSWAEIATAIGWCEITLRAHYQLHIGTPETRYLRFTVAICQGTLELTRKRYGYHFNGAVDTQISQALWHCDDELKKADR